MEGLWIGWFVPLAAVFYLVPSIICIGREHHRYAAILLINIFLGWTVIGWVIALRLALSHTVPAPRPPRGKAKARAREEEESELF